LESDWDLLEAMKPHADVVIEFLSGDDFARLDEEERQRDADLLAKWKEFTDTAVIEQFGTWVVTDYGVECLTHPYWIDKKVINRGKHQSSWEYHMLEKGWLSRVAYYDFLHALYFARDHFKKPKGSK
jgi:hypothetical protein